MTTVSPRARRLWALTLCVLTAGPVAAQRPAAAPSPPAPSGTSQLATKAELNAVGDDLRRRIADQGAQIADLRQQMEALMQQARTLRQSLEGAQRRLDASPMPRAR